MFNVTKLSFILLLIMSCGDFILAQGTDMQNEQMQIWMEYMTPGPMHEMLAKSVGDWKTTSKFWMDPASDPMVVEGTGKTEMILGGRYQKSTHKSTMMGMKTEGISIMIMPLRNSHLSG
jgi:hypothetical protein